MKVMLLAAGKGTRMLPLTQHTPKPLLQAGGRSLIEHQILKLKAAGFTRFVINHAWLGRQLEDALGDGARLGVHIDWSREDEPLETAGGIIRALPLLGSAPFAVVNADIWTDYPFARLQAALVPGMHVHLVLVPNPDHNPRGDFVLDAAGRAQLRATAAEPSHTFSGIAVYDPACFDAVGERKYPLLPLLERAIRAGRASAELHAGVWQDIGTPERLRALDLSLASGVVHD